ncbi:MAG: phosphatidylglycerophosphatase A, partial [Halothiobacillus sp. 15-55-196]
MPHLARRVWRDPVLWLAFGFGSGLAPKAPGTFGTLPG